MFHGQMGIWVLQSHIIKGQKILKYHLDTKVQFLQIFPSNQFIAKCLIQHYDLALETKNGRQAS